MKSPALRAREVSVRVRIGTRLARTIARAALVRLARATSKSSFWASGEPLATSRNPWFGYDGTRPFYCHGQMAALPQAFRGAAGAGIRPKPPT